MCVCVCALMSVTNGSGRINQLVAGMVPFVYNVVGFVSDPCIWTVRLMCFEILGLTYFGNCRLRDVYMISRCCKVNIDVLDMLHVVYDL